MHHTEPWKQFIDTFSLNQTQEEQFRAYAQALITYNKDHNVTTVTAQDAIISRHFEDSLELSRAIDIFTVNSICDIGTGGGFPGIALKIAFPHLQVTLIEVNKKKVEFLTILATQLNLTHVSFYTQDWRTFLRESTKYTPQPIDLFLSRASLQPEELIRIYLPSSPYKSSKMVYWASKQWQPHTPRITHFIHKVHTYFCNSIERKLIFFAYTPT